MGVTAGIFLASILLNEMCYLVYIRYLWVHQGAMQLKGLTKTKFIHLFEKRFSHSTMPVCILKFLELHMILHVHIYTKNVTPGGIKP
jgi:hypothetical protein